MENRRCSTCKQELPVDAFGRNRAGKNGLQARCKKCHSAEVVASQRNNREAYNTRNREWGALNRRSQRGYHMKRKFGLTIDEYEAMLAAQGGLCALCGRAETCIHPQNGKVKRLHVDHDHETGQVRALLCNACNVGLGVFGDSVARLQQAIDYLNAPREARVIPEQLSPGPATGRRNGKYTHPEATPRGASHGMAKLDQARVDRIFALADDKMYQRDIAAVVNVSQATVHNVLAGKLTWRRSISN